MSEQKYVFMRVNAAGYVGEPVSMLCSFDPATDILFAMKTVAYEDRDRPGFLRVTTLDRDSTRDMLFTEDETREAITAFFELDAMKLVNLAPDLQRYAPAHVIEREGMDEHGMIYRIKPDITNGQYAVLIAAYVAQKQRKVSAISDFLEQVFTTIE
jgi:hypothetical protein